MILSGTMLTHFKKQSLSLFNFQKVQNKINTHFTTTQNSADDSNLSILNSPAHRRWNTIMPCAVLLSFCLAPNSLGNCSFLSDLILSTLLMAILRNTAKGTEVWTT